MTVMFMFIASKYNFAYKLYVFCLLRSLRPVIECVFSSLMKCSKSTFDLSLFRFSHDQARLSLGLTQKNQDGLKEAYTFNRCTYNVYIKGIMLITDH